MKSNNDLISDFYKDNPQIFFIRETNEKPPWLHTAFTSPVSLDDDSNKTMVDEPAFEYNQDKTIVDEKPVFLTKSQLNSIKPRGKFSSALKKIGLASVGVALITTLMISQAWHLDKNQNNQENTSTPASIEKIVDNTPKQLQDEIEEELSKELPSITYKTELDEDETIYNILKHEGYQAFPYPDVKQWSVGNGTKVSDKPYASSLKHMSKEKVKDLRKEWKEKKNESVSALKDWVHKHIPTWREDFYEKYGISAENQAKDSDQNGLSEDSSEEASNVAFGKILRQLKSASYEFSKDDTFKYWHLAPSHVKQVLVDLYYNMGLKVLLKFKQFNKNLGFALANLNKDIISDQDIQNAEIGIQSAARELLNNFDENDEIKSSTSYVKQNKKRAKKNFEILATTPIERTGYKMVKIERNNLKSVYNHIFS